MPSSGSGAPEGLAAHSPNSGWQQAWDCTWSCWYHYNQALQLTQWEPPDAPFQPFLITGRSGRAARRAATRTQSRSHEAEATALQGVAQHTLLQASEGTHSQGGNAAAGAARRALPRRLTRFWFQRYSLWTRFDKGILMDEAGWFSVTPEVLAAHHAHHCHSLLQAASLPSVRGSPVDKTAALAEQLSVPVPHSCSPTKEGTSDAQPVQQVLGQNCSRSAPTNPEPRAASIGYDASSSTNGQGTLSRAAEAPRVEIREAGLRSAAGPCMASHACSGLFVDAFAGVGGNAIQAALAGFQVLAVDTDAARLALVAHNAEIYGVRGCIDLLCADFFQAAPRLQADVIFLSPPWGGLAYRDKTCFHVCEDFVHIFKEASYRQKAP
ncbi:hypothetical protein WJX84_011869 [Apatococcus fuscideae]|uniref:Trimethylguanosine synthase n=1 Tax=Apatococcus fuscideae TaxID=2026836 RepID=A0AAW1TFF9_9CHLO